MIEQIGNAIRFLAFFVSAKTGTAGLTVTVDVYSPAGSLIVTAGAATDVGGGLYSYTLASGSVTTEGEYVCIFKTATATVDQQHIPALWVVGRAGVENIDAAISSIGGGGAPTTAAIADAVWDAALPGAYTGTRAGAIVAKLNVGAPTAGVIVIPAAPADVSLCRVYGHMETVDNKPAAGVSITFELLAVDVTKSERLISGRRVKVTTDAEGKLMVGSVPYVELQRNDQLTPAGTKYRVMCARLNLDKEITLTTELYDLADLVN